LWPVASCNTAGVMITPTQTDYQNGH